MKRHHLAIALFLLGSFGQQACQGPLPPTCRRWAIRAEHGPVGRPAPGLLPLRRRQLASQHGDRPSDPDVGGFTLLAHALDAQLLTLIKEPPRPPGRPRAAPPAGRRFYRAAMDVAAAQHGGPAAAGRRPAVASPRPPAHRPTTARWRAGAGQRRGSPLINAFGMPDAKDSSTTSGAGPGAQMLEQDEYAKPSTRSCASSTDVRRGAAERSGDSVDAAAFMPRASWRSSRAWPRHDDAAADREPANTYNMMTPRAGAGAGAALDLRASSRDTKCRDPGGIVYDQPSCSTNDRPASPSRASSSTTAPQTGFGSRCWRSTRTAPRIRRWPSRSCWL